MAKVRSCLEVTIDDLESALRDAAKHLPGDIADEVKELGDQQVDRLLSKRHTRIEKLMRQVEAYFITQASVTARRRR